MIIKEDDANSRHVRVTLLLPAGIWADRIHVVGDFNDWNRHSHPLTCSEQNWHITLELEAGRAYRFRYLIDDREWCGDWKADGSVASPRGGYDCLINI